MLTAPTCNGPNDVRFVEANGKRIPHPSKIAPEMRPLCKATGGLTPRVRMISPLL